MTNKEYNLKNLWENSPLVHIKLHIHMHSYIKRTHIYLKLYLCLLILTTPIQPNSMSLDCIPQLLPLNWDNSLAHSIKGVVWYYHWKEVKNKEKKDAIMLCSCIACVLTVFPHLIANTYTDIMLYPVIHLCMTDIKCSEY